MVAARAATTRRRTDQRRGACRYDDAVACDAAGSIPERHPTHALQFSIEWRHNLPARRTKCRRDSSIPWIARLLAYKGQLHPASARERRSCALPRESATINGSSDALCSGQLLQISGNRFGVPRDGRRVDDYNTPPGFGLSCRASRPRRAQGNLHRAPTGGGEHVDRWWDGSSARRRKGSRDASSHPPAQPETVSAASSTSRVSATSCLSPPSYRHPGAAGAIGVGRTWRVVMGEITRGRRVARPVGRVTKCGRTMSGRRTPIIIRKPGITTAFRGVDEEAKRLGGGQERDSRRTDFAR